MSTKTQPNGQAMPAHDDGHLLPPTGDNKDSTKASAAVNWQSHRLSERLKSDQHYYYGDYDVLIIGAGHAAAEAANAVVKLGHTCLMVGMNLDSLANLPCNPSIGGTAKGQLVKEIDAMGGLMGQIADESCIQFRMLNRSKGPAVLSPRAQVDRRRYSVLMKERLEALEGLSIRQDEITEILFDEQGRPVAAAARFGAIYGFKRLIIAAGTYLNARVIIGMQSFESGPDNLFPARGLSECLRDMGVSLQRFKTGTPVRVNLRTVDVDHLEVQEGEEDVQPFSFLNEDKPGFFKREQRVCYLAWTRPETHETIRENLNRSPLYSGLIEGVGPRYCPSIEDKIVRFADKERHQIFIEPMSEGGCEMYLQGLSTSMPQDVQLSMLKSISGLEHAHIQRTAYAIEYDCLIPTELRRNLSLRRYPDIYTAGQINGSSGYEEAAAQGLMAGINAARSIEGLTPIILDRSRAYIGVLIDDLVTKGTKEPYRMMTSRAEYRLILRQDNADERLSPLAHEIGLLDEERYRRFEHKYAQIRQEMERLNRERIRPDAGNRDLLNRLGTTPLQGGASLAELIRRPQLTYENIAPLDPERPHLPRSVRDEVNIRIKYEGYIRLEEQRILRYKKMEARRIPESFDYTALRGLRNEARDKLRAYRPETLAQASQISGVSPADISVLLIALEAADRRATEDSGGYQS